MTHWSHLFVGREAELEGLKNAYVEAASGRARVVAIIAESGFGKTRLVQKFYNWLSTHHDGMGSDGYWPDRLLQREDNLMVNPDVGEAGINEKPMPFLWWGLRLHDPDARNEIVSRALWSGLDILKAHLERYSREASKEEFSGRSNRVLLKGAVDLAVEVAGNLASFGLLGVGKTLLESGKTLYDLDRERLLMEQLDVSPGAADRRANDELIQTILTDLARLAKSPPRGLAPIPLVIVLDDAQWLSHDEGATAFAEALVKLARLENWPVLVILTSWEREWRDSDRAGAVPASLVSIEKGDVALYLGRASELAEVVMAAFPGLTEPQYTTILDQVDGNLRFLNEVLMYLARNPKYFEGRDLTAPLTKGGLLEVARREFPDFVADRFADAPDHVRRAMSLASLHGTVFSPRMVKFMAQHLALEGTDEGLAEGDDPHGFASIKPTYGEGEFRLRAYRHAAWDDLGNHMDEEAAQTALDAACVAAISDPLVASNRDLLLVLGGKDWASSIVAAAELIRRAIDRDDPRAAGTAAVAALPLVLNHIERVDTAKLSLIVDTYLAWSGPTRQIIVLIDELLSRARADVAHDQTSQHQVIFAHGLLRLGNAVDHLDGPATARPLFEEAVAIIRDLSEVQPDLHGPDLAFAISILAETVKKLGGSVDSRPLLEEAVAINRVLSELQPTHHRLFSLAFTLVGLGNVIETLGDSAVAQSVLEESVAILRSLVEYRSSPNDRHLLAFALSSLANTTQVLKGPAVARSLREEAVAIMRSLVVDRPTPIVQSGLALVLSLLGDTVLSLDGAVAALPLQREVVSIHRQLVEAHRTPDALGNLASALSSLRLAVHMLDGFAATLPLQREVVSICRQLAKEYRTPDTLGNLALELSYLQGIVETLDGPAAARPLCEEEATIRRALAEMRPTPGARAGT